MSRGESRTSVANLWQSAATALAGARRAADLSESQLPFTPNVETQLDDTVKTALQTEPPARFGNCATGEQEWEWTGGRKGAGDLGDNAKRPKFACYHCNLGAHEFAKCARWKKWVAVDKERRKACAKCGEMGHQNGGMPRKERVFLRSVCGRSSKKESR